MWKNLIDHLFLKKGAARHYIHDCEHTSFQLQVPSEAIRKHCSWSTTCIPFHCRNAEIVAGLHVQKLEITVHTFTCVRLKMFLSVGALCIESNTSPLNILHSKKNAKKESQLFPVGFQRSRRSGVSSRGGKGLHSCESGKSLSCSSH